MDAIFEKAKQDRHITSYNVAEELGIDHKTVLAHLKHNWVQKLDIWVPHEVTERNLMNRVLICDSLLRCNETEPFFKKLISRSGFTDCRETRVNSQQGDAVCVWVWKGIIHYKLLIPSSS
ncbi:jg24566 [Pararge aegeria aegeria]|uniref:Jg24566 protein n=1 Tax=Pararge aegeria aegeria TaxID=348720 RepID=A0A8S4QHR7_9NEOP|nr:jg24566 [Pararge aegeria aegeria]